MDKCDDKGLREAMGIQIAVALSTIATYTDLSDSDMEAIRKAVAGEGRLVFIGKDEITLCIGDEAKFTKGEAAVVIPEYLQDQGGE